MKSNEHYRPLPDGLTIKESKVEGLGLFSTKDLSEGSILGISHHTDPIHGLIRTPLGGFINHSLLPNLQRIESSGGIWHLKVTRDIPNGGELFLRYREYDPTDGGPKRLTDRVLTEECGFTGDWTCGYSKDDWRVMVFEKEERLLTYYIGRYDMDFSEYRTVSSTADLDAFFELMNNED